VCYNGRRQLSEAPDEQEREMSAYRAVKSNNSEWTLRVIYKPIYGEPGEKPQPAFAVDFANDHCYVVDQFRYSTAAAAESRMLELLADLNGVTVAA
jgi:hypothetical protein